jgi:hypothetical protein
VVLSNVWNNHELHFSIYRPSVVRCHRRDEFWLTAALFRERYATPATCYPHGSAQVTEKKETLMNKTTVKAVVAAALIALLPLNTSLAQSGPFTHFAGAWSGGGTVLLDDGSTERIRCRANYRVDEAGGSLEQTLRCASDSYGFDVESNVMSRAGNVFGSWTESNRNISGHLEGRAGGGQVSAAIEAPGFTATLRIVLHGKKQSISINSSSQIRHVSVSLSRI